MNILQKINNSVKDQINSVNSNIFSYKLSEDVINKIKGFNQEYLTNNQRILIDNLIPNDKLKERYKKYGLCKECGQPNTGKAGFNYTGYGWCQPCNSKHFQQNFNKWTSGNKKIDEFLQKFQLNATCKDEVIEWIPYERFENIEYLAKGGFGSVYKAKWIDGYISYWNINKNDWLRVILNDGGIVVLKWLDNSENLTTDFLQENIFHKKLINSYIVKYYGISQDPKTKNFIIVMEYWLKGNMRQFLNNKFNNLSLQEKLWQFRSIANGLKIHDQGLIHKNLHPGNILSSGGIEFYISDLGICRPVNEKDKKKIYGVLPYVAPEVLRGKAYTQAADIYSFGILMCEILCGLPIYYDLPHDKSLATKICQGLRPKLNDNKIPNLLKSIINPCLDANPLKRPTADELLTVFEKMSNIIIERKNTKFYQQYLEAEQLNETESLKSNTSLKALSYTIHPQAIYYSRFLDYKNLPKPQNSKKAND